MVSWCRRAGALPSLARPRRLQGHDAPSGGLTRPQPPDPAPRRGDARRDGWADGALQARDGNCSAVLRWEGRCAGFRPSGPDGGDRVRKKVGTSSCVSVRSLSTQVAILTLGRGYVHPVVGPAVGPFRLDDRIDLRIPRPDRRPPPDAGRMGPYSLGRISRDARLAGWRAKGEPPAARSTGPRTGPGESTPQWFPWPRDPQEAPEVPPLRP